MEEEKIDAVKALPEPKSVRNIHLFIRFANFYWYFIQDFSKIATPQILILKMSAQPANALPATGINNSKVVESSGRNDRKSAKSDFTKSVRGVKEPSFLSLNS